MLTRRHPAAIAASSDSSSRIPPLISTWMSRVPTILRLELAVVPVAERRVEVDEVDPLRARLLPAQRRLDRVAEALLRPVHALHQLDGLAALDVDGGQELEVGLLGSAGHGSILGAVAILALRSRWSGETAAMIDFDLGHRG